jgi:hypothetical protein
MSATRRYSVTIRRQIHDWTFSEPTFSIFNRRDSLRALPAFVAFSNRKTESRKVSYNNAFNKKSGKPKIFFSLTQKKNRLTQKKNRLTQKKNHASEKKNRVAEKNIQTNIKNIHSEKLFRKCAEKFFRVAEVFGELTKTSGKRLKRKSRPFDCFGFGSFSKLSNYRN